MLKSELIAKLQEIEGDIPVRIFDHRKSLNQDVSGTYPVDPFLIDQWADWDDNEKAFWLEEHETPLKPFIALSFDNEDFDVWAHCSNKKCNAHYECANTVMGNKSTCPKCGTENNNIVE